MKRIKQQIKESFFNPVLHFLPLIVFMIVDDFWGLTAAWISALAVTFIILIHVYFSYRKVLEWFLFSASIFLVVASIGTFIPYEKLPAIFRLISIKYILLVIFALSLIFRKKIELFIDGRNKKMLSMQNNFDELFNMMWLLGSVIFIYVHIYILAFVFEGSHLQDKLEIIHYSYVFVLFAVMLYQIMRVTFVRFRLLREEWWPIVNEQGKTIGSIQHNASLSDTNKYMHPIIRVFLIDNNRIFLQKRTEKSLVFPGLWDTTISNHIRLNETIEQCVQRTAFERYNLEHLRPIFLSNYMHETADEFHYAFLFVACRLPFTDFNKDYIDHAKWWTLAQIEDNIDAGIFTDNLLIELDLLKRSGLLDSGSCNCECNLKDTIDGVSKQKVV
jgi:isopentenyldiphosphate isomerase